MSEPRETPDFNSKHLAIYLGRLDSQYVMGYFTVLISLFFMSKLIPGFWPVALYMGTVGAIILAVLIRKARREAKL